MQQEVTVWKVERRWVRGRHGDRYPTATLVIVEYTAEYVVELDSR